ncbi:disulfide isomerase [Ramaria rubella]|nr:disulfide isomerase [Ramaria rubella]
MMHSLARFVLTLVVGASVACAGEVVELEEINFDRWVGAGKPALVEFWAPWCDHCQTLEPVYKELADVFDHVSNKLVFGKVNHDAMGSKSLIDKYGVTGLPTIKYFDADGKSEDYDPEAGRTLDELVAFVTKRSGLKSRLATPASPPPEVTIQLTSANFDKIVNDPEKDVLVSFTATWCGHCKALKPIYNFVAWNFRSEEHIVIANLDGDADPDRSLATKYNVTGYPILKLFPKGSKEQPIDYKLPRDERNLVRFLNEHTGTQRAVGGGLTDQAGRSAHLDELAAQFVSAVPAERPTIYKKAKTASISAGKPGKQYLRIMEKLTDGKDDYLTQERTRLSGILSKRALSDEKLDEIKIKSNILSTFVSVADKKMAEGVRIETASKSSDEPVETEGKRVKEEL